VHHWIGERIAAEVGNRCVGSGICCAGVGAPQAWNVSDTVTLGNANEGLNFLVKS
jgi:hypothetical protein